MELTIQDPARRSDSQNDPETAGDSRWSTSCRHLSFIRRPDQEPKAGDRRHDTLDKPVEPVLSVIERSRGLFPSRGHSPSGVLRACPRRLGWRLSDRRRSDSPLFLARDDGGSDDVDGGQALGRRAHLRMGLHQPPPRQGLRALRSHRAGPVPDRHDKAHVPTDRRNRPLSTRRHAAFGSASRSAFHVQGSSSSMRLGSWRRMRPRMSAR